MRQRHGASAGRYRGHIFEADQDVGLDEIVLTDGNRQCRIINH